MSAGEQKGWTPERSQRAIALLEAMTKRYRELVGAASRACGAGGVVIE
jgi:hypothetical protein